MRLTVPENPLCGESEIVAVVVPPGEAIVSAVELEETVNTAPPPFNATPVPLKATV